MKKIILAFFILHFTSFHFLSKAQTISFLDVDKHPVEGLIVTVHELSTGKEKIIIADNKGKVVAIGLTPPLEFRTFHFAFREKLDTLFVPGTRTITLVSNNVNLKEISITGNYGPTDHSLYNTEVISREEIDSRAVVNLTDLFVHQLNARISNDPSTGSSVSIMGIGGENIKILIDGVPVIGRLYNNINPSQLNLNNASRVEIIKGPASVLYGTNALGGVINIITEAGSGTPLEAGLNSYYESTGQYNADAFANFQIKKTNLSLTGGRNFFEGWSEKDTSRFKDWKPKEQYFSNVRVSHAFNKTRITVQSSFFDEKVIAKSSTVRGWPYEAYAFDDYFKTIRFNNTMQVNHLVDATHSLQLTGAYSYYCYTHEYHRKDLIQLSDSIYLKDPNDFGAGMLRMVYTKDNAKSKLNFQTGIDLNTEYTSGNRIKDNKQQVGDYAVFASVQYKILEPLVISPSVRVAYNNTYHAPIVPSLQTIYTINPNTLLRASYSSGFRSPSLKELYLNFDIGGHQKVLGNSLLKSENSHHLLSSVEFTKDIGKCNFRLSPSLFYNKINNKITLAAQGDIYTYINLLSYVTKGAQLSAGFRVGDFKINTGVSYTGIYNQLEEASEGIPFTYTTEINSGVEYSIKKTGTSFAAYWKYNGGQPVYFLDENNSVKLFTGESFSMFDLSIVQQLFNKRMTVATGLKNILNVTKIKNMQQASAHQSSDDYALTGMGRSLFVRLQLQLHK